MEDDKPSLRDVKNYLQHEYFYATDPYMDGWTTFARKQNMYKVKWLAEEYLAKCSTYAGEEEWIAEYQTELALKKLGYDNEAP